MKNPKSIDNESRMTPNPKEIDFDPGTFNVPRKSRYELRPVSVTPHNTPTSPGYRPPFRPQISSFGDYKTYRDREPESSPLRRYNNYEDLRGTDETPTTYKETPTTFKSILKNPQTSTEYYESEKEKTPTAPKKPERLRDFEHISSPTRIMSKNLWASRDADEIERPNSRFDGNRSTENYERKSVLNPRPETLNIDETDSLRRPRPHTLVLKQSNVPDQTWNRNRDEPEQTRIQVRKEPDQTRILNWKEPDTTRNRNRAVSDHSESDQDTVPDDLPIHSAQADRDESRPSSVLKVQF